MICAIFRVCAMITETPISPLPSSSMTMDVVSESVPRPPHFSSSVMVRMPTSLAALDDLPGKTFRGILLGIERRRPRLDLGFNETLDGLQNDAADFPCG